MARVANYKVTNRSTTVTRAITLYDLEEATSYVNKTVSTTKSETDKMSNRTVSNDMHGEIVEYWYADTKSYESNLTQYSNSPADGSSSYGVSLDIMLVAEDIDSNCCALDNEIREPIHVEVKFKHNKSPYISESFVLEALGRAVSALIKSDGTSRIGDLMRGSVNPKDNM